MSDCPPIELRVTQGSMIGRSKSFQQPYTSIGRAEDADFLVEGPGVSRRHLAIFFRDGRYWARNESRNGTEVNNHAIATDTALADRDVIRIGEDACMVFRCGDLHPPVTRASTLIADDTGRPKMPAAGARRPWYRNMLFQCIGLVYAVSALILLAVFLTGADKTGSTSIAISSHDLQDETMRASLLNPPAGLQPDDVVAREKALEGIRLFEERGQDPANLVLSLANCREAIGRWGYRQFSRFRDEAAGDPLQHQVLLTTDALMQQLCAVLQGALEQAQICECRGDLSNAVRLYKKSCGILRYAQDTPLYVRLRGKVSELEHRNRR